MPFKKPTLSEIHNRILVDMALGLNDGRPIPDVSEHRVLATVMAGQSFGLYQYLEWISRQAFADSCDDDKLERITAIKKVFRKMAQASSGMIRFTGNPAASIPRLSQLTREDGTQYQTTLDSTIVNGIADVPCECLERGKMGDTPTDARLTLIKNLTGVDSCAKVLAPGLTGGADPETHASLLHRYLNRMRYEPSGGNLSDYKRWMEDLPGVGRAWVYSHINCPDVVKVGEVQICFITSDPSGLIPSDAQIQSIQKELRKKAPATAHLQLFAPKPLEHRLSIRITPESNEITRGVESRLSDLYVREASPNGRIQLAAIYAAISKDNRIRGFEITQVPTVGILQPTALFTIPIFQGVQWVTS